MEAKAKQLSFSINEAMVFPRFAKKNNMALHLRFLQSLVEVSAEKNSTIVFPVPIDPLAPFSRRAKLGSTGIRRCPWQLEES